MMFNAAGYFYPPNNDKYTKQLSEEGKELHPHKISNPLVFDEYEKV